MITPVVLTTVVVSYFFIGFVVWLSTMLALIGEARTNTYPDLLKRLIRSGLLQEVLVFLFIVALWPAHLAIGLLYRVK